MDMLVDLYALPAFSAEEPVGEGVRILRALAPDKSRIVAFARRCGDRDYGDEAEAAFANQPVTCFIAVKEGRLVGFACFEATAKNFFGPMAVEEKERGQGIGRALLLASLHAMREMGYGYAVIGWPARAAVGFYEKCVNARAIERTSPGVYGRMIEMG